MERVALHDEASWMSEDLPTVLIVEDEKELADLYSSWLSGFCTVRTAYTGGEAIALLDDRVDVLLLDRDLPDQSGDEVLATIHERNLACQVALLTGVTPDFDIIDLGFDVYVRKPVSKGAVTETVETLLTRATYDEQLQKYFALVSKRATLEREKGAQERETNQNFTELIEALDEHRHDLERLISDFDEEDFVAVFRSMTRDSTEKR